MLWLGTGEFASRAIAFIVAITLARHLGVESYGALGVALALVSYLVVLVDGGLDPAAVREVARKPASVPALIRLVVGRRLLVACATYGLLILLVFLLPDRAVGGKALALLFGGRLFTAALKCDWALRGREDMKAVALGVIIQHVLYAAGMFVVMTRSDVPMVFIPIVHVGAEAVLAVLYLRWLRRSYHRLLAPPTPDLPHGLLHESLPVGLAKILRLAYFEGDLMLLAWLAPPEQSGYFFASHRIVLSLVALGVVHQQTVFPTLSRLMHVSPSSGVQFQETMSRYALAWSVPIAAGSVFLSLPIVELLFGAAYRPTAPILTIMLLGLPILLLQIGWHHQMLALGQTRPYLYTVAAGTIAHIGLGLLWAPKWGGVGAAWASVAGESITCGLAGGYAWVQHRQAPLGGRSLAVCAAGACMLTAMFVARHLSVFAVGAIGIAAYGAAALAFGGFTLQEARKLFALFGRRAQPHQ